MEHQEKKKKIQRQLAATWDDGFESSDSKPENVQQTPTAGEGVMTLELQDLLKVLVDTDMEDTGLKKYTVSIQKGLLRGPSLLL